MSTGAVGAQTKDVVVQTETVKLVDGEGTVTISNLTIELITVASATVDNCGFLDPPAVPLPAGERTEVALSTECDLDGEATVTFTFENASGSPVNPPTAEVTVKSVSSSEPEWGLIGWSYLFAAIAATVCVVVVRLRIAQFNAIHRVGKWHDSFGDSLYPDGKPKHLTRRGHPANNESLKLDDVRRWWKSGLFEDHQHWIANDETGNKKEKCTRIEDEKGEVGWTFDLGGLGTGWSFNENWAANATLASSLLAAVLVGSDLLTELLGDNAESALALLAVSGAVAALLVGIGPLILKAIGRKVETPTVGGMFTASGLATVGILGQIFLLTRLAFDLLVDLGAFFTVAGGVALALLMLVYAMRAMEFNLVSGLSVPTQKPAIDEVVKQSIAALAAEVGELGSAIVALQPNGSRLEVKSAEERDDLSAEKRVSLIVEQIDNRVVPAVEEVERNGLI